MKPPPLLALTTSFAALGAAPAARAQFTTPHTISTTGPVSTTLGGTTFINQGLQGVGRIPASARDAFGDTFGSVSSLVVTNFVATGNGS